MDNTVLVTGGAGFIGQTLVNRLLQDQYRQVVLYDNFVTGHQSILNTDHPDLSIVSGDIRNRESLEHVLRQYRPRVVYHLAALHFIPYCNAHPEETLSVNVVGLQTLLSACRQVPVERLVFASTAAIYPIFEEANREDHPADPVDIYGMSKYFGEKLVRRFSADTGTLCTVGRFFNAYGPGETNPHVIPEIMGQVKKGNTLQLGNLDPKRDYIYIDDMASALDVIGRKSTADYEVYNIGSGKEYSVRELVAVVESLVGRPLTISQDKQRMRRVERRHLLADINKIRQQLNWQPSMTINEGLYDTLKAYDIPTLS